MNIAISLINNFIIIKNKTYYNNCIGDLAPNINTTKSCIHKHYSPLTL